jgi:hypothetical protein
MRIVWGTSMAPNLISMFKATPYRGGWVPTPDFPLGGCRPADPPTKGPGDKRTSHWAQSAPDPWYEN